jgi:RimJ/RimL family protein N-acetyltransferase/SAM-dependent methyltransferase
MTSTRPVIATPRLRLEPLTDGHTDLLVELDSDPEVVRHIFGRALSREEVVDTWMPRRTRPDADARGLGYWVGFEAGSGAFVGWWCLAVDDAHPTAAELGYRLRRETWGRSLATEGARALVEHGFATAGLERIWAHTMVVNRASHAVLAKVGLLEVDTRHDEWPYPVEGAEHGVVDLALTRDQWQRQVSWDAEAPAYDEAADHGLRDPACRAAWRELLVGVLPPAPARVADLGCGTATLSLLLAGEGHRVDGVDQSPEMLARAQTKVAEADVADLVTLTPGDAAAPQLEPAAYDVVLSRHVLWALPDPADALDRWVSLLRPGGRLVLVEGSWSTGAGLTAVQTRALVEATGRPAEVTPLTDPVLWGREIDDERYLVVS